MSSDVKDILVDRQKTHGDFTKNSVISQNLKLVMHTGNNWGALYLEQREALEMIAHKIGRILGGDSKFQDHWDDIVGYATLAAEHTKRRNQATETK